MKATLPLFRIFAFLLLAVAQASAQTCPFPSDNQSTQGTNNRWLAYFYRNDNFTLYHGRVTYENANNNLDFDLNFQGANTDYQPSADPAASANTFQCGLNTETFSARFRIRQSFAAGVYDFTIGSTDGVRLLIDGVQVLNQPNERPYQEFKVSRYLFGGLHTITIEYTERTGENRLRFQMRSGCQGTAFTSPDYATGTQWNAYFYQGINFDEYKGKLTVGTPNMNYVDLDFGGDAVIMHTDECAIYTDEFSARLFQRRYAEPGTYLFTLGGDDGYRLSIDGGNTWIIEEWYDHGIQTTAVAVVIPTARYLDMVIEYYDAGQGNALIFDIGWTLPVKLIRFDGKNVNNTTTLTWQTADANTEDHFIVERSSDGKNFKAVGTVPAASAISLPNQKRQYTFREQLDNAGIFYYRLKMIDQSATQEYSHILTINMQDDKKIKVYPTIVSQNRQLYIRAGNKLNAVQLVLSDFSGRQILVKDLGNLSAGQLTTLSLQQATVSKGRYLINLYAQGDLVHKQSIIIQ